MLSNETILETLEVIREDDDIRQTFRKITSTVDWKYAHGACKSCFIPPVENFVIKIDNEHDSRRNGCQEEVENYAVAEKWRVQPILLESRKIGTLSSGRSVYVQEKITFTCDCLPRTVRERYERKTRKISDDLVYKIKENCPGGWCIDNLWLKMLILIYGKRFARSFQEWVSENRINDLHDGNLGYKDGHPVILDYSGY